MTVVFVLGKKKSYFVTNHNFYASWGFPCGSAGKEIICNARELGSIPGLGRSPGEGKGYPNSSILAWRIPWGCKELDTTEQLLLSLSFITSIYMFKVAVYICHTTYRLYSGNID